MDTDTRKDQYLTFMKDLGSKVTEKNSIFEQFEGKKSMNNQTLEGEVFKWDLTLPHLAIKVVDLKNLIQVKKADQSILSKKPHTFYKFIAMGKSFMMPSLIEIIGMTLTNQLVLQRICPHFMMNYYWEYQEKTNKLIYYNELATEDMTSFLRRPHTFEVYHNVMFQIFVALLTLRYHFNMYHIDLHSGNILIMHSDPLEHKHTTYTINNIKYYLPNLGYTVLIQDFGFAYIPKMLYIPWLLESRIKSRTTVGLELYDVGNFYNFSTQFKYFNTYRKSYLIDTLGDFASISHFKLPYWKMKLQKARLVGEKAEIEIKLEDYNTSYEANKNFTLYKIFKSLFKNFTIKNKTTTNGLRYNIYTHMDKSKIPRQLRKLVDY